MPIYRHFYVEHRGSDGWGIPDAFEPMGKVFAPELGQFAWVHPRAGWLDLFWGDDAIFPFQNGAPPESEKSPLLNHLKNREYDFEQNEDSVSWLPFPELLIDDWENETVLVGYRVEARWASYFGDGNSPFPTNLLNHPEFRENLGPRQHARQWRGDPINGTLGADRFRLSKLPPTAEFDVTYGATVAEYIGDKYAQLFASLRDYGRDEDLRILSVRG